MENWRHRQRAGKLDIFLIFILGIFLSRCCLSYFGFPVSMFALNCRTLKTCVLAKMMKFIYVNKIQRKTKMSDDLLIIPLSRDEVVALQLLSKARNSILLTGEAPLGGVCVSQICPSRLC